MQTGFKTLIITISVTIKEGAVPREVDSRTDSQAFHAFYGKVTFITVLTTGPFLNLVDCMSLVITNSK
jgi:hypothetical protein